MASLLTSINRPNGLELELSPKFRGGEDLADGAIQFTREIDLPLEGEEIRCARTHTEQSAG